MPDLPWTSFAEREPKRQYVALLSYLPLRRPSSGSGESVLEEVDAFQRPDST